jgi:hypothetical protein
MHDKEVYDVEGPMTWGLRICCVLSRQGEDRFERRISHFIILRWGIVTVIIAVVFIREVNVFTTADLTRLKRGVTCQDWGRSDILMKVITKRATRLWRASLGSADRDAAARLLSGALGLSFRLPLAPWGIAPETAAVFSVATLLAERRFISVKWEQRLSSGDVMNTR